MSSDIEWEFAGAVVDGARFEIGGIDVWTRGWRDTGARAHVKDPLYHLDFTFPVYEIGDPGAAVTFAAGEFSNGIWGFFVRAEATRDASESSTR